jgi:hypothetical protein
MSVPGCCLMSLKGCGLPLRELDEARLDEIFDRVGRTRDDTQSRQSGICQTHWNKFFKNWGKSRIDRRIPKTPICDLCATKGRFKHKKRKSLAWTISWNHDHTQSAPLQAGPLVCDACAVPAKRVKLGLEVPANPTCTQAPTTYAWVDTQLVPGNDTGDLSDDSSDGGDASGGCMYTFFDDGCEPDTVTTRCCFIQCCDVCAAHTNWTCMKCYKPFDGLKYDPNHRYAGEHRQKRDCFLDNQITHDGVDLNDEERMEVDEVVNATNEDEEYMQLHAMQPVRSSTHPRFFIIWEDEDDVCFEDLHGRNHTVPREVYQERCELLLAIDSHLNSDADVVYQQRPVPLEQANSGRQQANSGLQRRVVQLEAGHAELVGANAVLMEANAGLMEANAELKAANTEMRAHGYQREVKLQEAERNLARKNVLLAAARARQKTLILSAKRREKRIQKVENELKQTKERLLQLGSDEGKMAVVMEFVKRQIFGTITSRPHSSPREHHSHCRLAVFAVKKGKRSYRWSFKKAIVEASKNCKSMRAVRGPIATAPFVVQFYHPPLSSSLLFIHQFERLIGPILQKWFVRCSLHSLGRNLTSRS